VIPEEMVREDLRKWNGELQEECEALKKWMKQRELDYRKSESGLCEKLAVQRLMLVDARVRLELLAGMRCLCGGVKGRHEPGCETMELAVRMAEAIR
jgi:hypothetical protein